MGAELAVVELGAADLPVPLVAQGKGNARARFTRGSPEDIVNAKFSGDWSVNDSKVTLKTSFGATFVFNFDGQRLTLVSAQGGEAARGQVAAMQSYSGPMTQG